MIKNIANKVMIGKGIFLEFSAVIFVTFKCHVQFYFSSEKAYGFVEINHTI